MNDEFGHPTDSELVDLVDGTLPLGQIDHIRSHVDNCQACQVRLARDTGPIELNVDQFLSGLPSPQNLPSVAKPLQEALTQRSRPEPRPGQLWHLQRDDTAALGVIYKVTGERALVIPAALEAHLADQYTIIIDASHSPLGHALGLWVSLPSLVDRDVLSAHVADLNVVDDIETVHDDFVSGRVPRSIPTGVPTDGPLDPRWRYRRHLNDLFASLSSLPADVELNRQVQPQPEKGVAADVAAHYVLDGQHRVAAFDEIIRAIRMTVPEAHVIPDPEVDLVVSGSRPLQLGYVLQLVDLPIRIAVDPSATTPEELERDVLRESANLVGLLRDCDLLAVVGMDELHHTSFVGPYELDLALNTPPGERRKAILTTPEPLELAFGRLREENLLPDDLFDSVALDSIDVDLPAVVTQSADDAFEEQRGRRWQPPKKEAFQELTAADVAAIGKFVEQSADRKQSEYQPTYQQQVLRTAA